MADLPVRLDRAGAWRVYLGGSLIRELNGEPGTKDDHFPEEWIVSTTAAKGNCAEGGDGLSRILPDGSLTLSDLIRTDPVRFLGTSFVKRNGENTGVLLKLLDAAERLNVQIHPDRDTAMQYWNSPFGKTECWHFLYGRPIEGQLPRVYLGLREYVTKDLLRKAFESEDSRRILDCMYSFPAVPGETVLVDGGIPHAIGAGCFLLELQEPTDLTLRLEKATSSGTRVDDVICHLGMGFDAMFDSIRYEHMPEDEIRRRYFIPPKVLLKANGGCVTQLLGYDRCPYFSFEQIDVQTELEVRASSVFSGLFILSGHGFLSAVQSRIPLSPGDQFFLPAAAGDLRFTVQSPMRMIRFYGPQTA
ncbi:MAG: type I phosphomannose isomerase catalytic subunit [Oscillospiraceae bacterium]